MIEEWKWIKEFVDLLLDPPFTDLKEKPTKKKTDKNESKVTTS